MKILHVLSQTELTGSEVYAQKLIDDLTARGHDVHALSDTFHLPFRASCGRMEFNSNSFWPRWRNIFLLRAYLKKNQFDVVHCHSRLAAKNIHRAAFGLGLPVVTTLHGMQHASFSKKLINSYGDQVISVCKNLTEDLLQKTNLRREQILDLPNPIFSEGGQAGPTGQTVIFAGRNSGPKGSAFRELLHSQMEWWAKKFPHVEWRIFLHGLEDGSFFSEYMRVFPHVLILGDQVDLAEEFRRPGSVVFASGRTAIEALLSGAQVLGLGEAGYVGPLTEENFSQAIDSNFGDMGEIDFADPLRVTRDLEKILSGRGFDAPAHELLLSRVKEHYQPQKIFEQIERLYFSVRMKKKCAAIPILMYHRVPDRELLTQHRTFVTRKKFNFHLRVFSILQRTTISFSELADFWFARKSIDLFPKHPLIITFDDGYRDLLTNAQPLLRSARQKATVFLLSRADYKENSWDDVAEGELSELLSPSERAQLDRSVFEIGSHGHDHVDYTQIDDQKILEQMIRSKAELEKEFRTPVTAFAFPFGKRLDQYSQLAAKARYVFAVNTDQGPEDFFADPFALSRVNIFPEENFFSLWKKTRPAYHRRSWRKRSVVDNSETK